MSEHVGNKAATLESVASSSGKDDFKGSEIDFGLISEYLTSEKKLDTPKGVLSLEDDSAHGVKAYSTDVSDEEGLLYFHIIFTDLVAFVIPKHNF